MSMSIWEMSSPRFPPFEGQMRMPMARAWDLAHAAHVAVMWWAMMMAMMLPGLLARQVCGRSKASVSVSFVTQYAAVWSIASLVAAVAQFGFEQAGWLDTMHLWSVSKGLTLVLISCAAASQIWWQFALRRSDESVSGSVSGVEYGRDCVLSTGPVMLLLFAGGVMNLYWIATLTVWNMAMKIWPRSYVLPGATILVCLCLALLV